MAAHKPTPSPVLYRAAFEMLPAEGRTLLGLAVPWDRPAKVRDLTGPAYLEAFSPDSCDASMRQRETYPLFVRHDYTEDPLGPVTFTRSREGLLFRAPLSATKRADECLELVNDGAMRGTSVGFVPVAAVLKRMVGSSEAVKYRTGVNLREMSLTPTGFGQYADAGVTAVRSTSGSFDDVEDAVEDAITQKLYGAAGPPETVYLCVVDIGPGWAVYKVEGGALDLAVVGAQFQRVEYTVAEDGSVTLGEPENVVKAWAPGEVTSPAATGEPVERDMTRVSRFRDISDRMRQTSLMLGNAGLGLDVLARDFTQKERDVYASSGVAMKDGSYPIPSAEYLQKAVDAVGRAAGSHDDVRKHIIERAHALGAGKGAWDDWNPDGSLKA